MTTYDAAKDAEQNKVMAILAYFGILVLIPLLAAKESRFARFHAGQGLILLIACVGYAIVQAILLAIFGTMGIWRFYLLLSTLLSLVYIGFGLLAILGIINAAGGKEKELPLIGKYRILK